MPTVKKQTVRSRGPFGLSIPEAGAMIGLGRNASYEAARRGKIPTLEFGALKIVPRIPWLKQIGAHEALATSTGLFLFRSLAAKQRRRDAAKSATQSLSRPPCRNWLRLTVLRMLPLGCHLARPASGQPLPGRYLIHSLGRLQRQQSKDTSSAISAGRPLAEAIPQNWYQPSLGT